MALGAVIGSVFGLASAFANKGADDAAVAAQNDATNRQYQYNTDMWNWSWEDTQAREKYAQQGIDIQRGNIESEYGYRDETAARDWAAGMRIQDFKYTNELKQFIQSEKNYSSQLKFNNIAAAMAHESEQRKLKEIKIGQAFQAEDRMISSIEKEGEAQATGQAGRSMGKRLQAEGMKTGMAEGRAMESARSAETQFQKSIAKINLEKYGADLNAEAQRMIKPEREPALPKPMKLPRPVLQDAYVSKKPPAPVKGAMATSAGWGGVLGAAGGVMAATSGVKDWKSW